MQFNSIGKAFAAMLVLFIATPAMSGVVWPFDAVQFSGAPPATQIVSSTPCTPSMMTLTCTSLTGGTVEIGMVVFDATTSTNVPYQTTVTAVSGTTITLTMSTSVLYGDTVEFIGQQINDQLGTSFSLSGGTGPAGFNWELSEGTAANGAAFAGPMVKLSKYEDIPAVGGMGQCNSAIHANCNAVLYIGVNSAAGDQMESQGLDIEMRGYAENSTCGGGNCNISGFQEYIESDPAGGVQGETPSGGLIQVVDNGSGGPTNITGMKGFEIDADNKEIHSGSNVDCAPLNGNAYGICNDLVLVSNGMSAVSAGLQIRSELPATFIEGVVFTQSCCTSSTIDDYSSSANSILIQGSHSTAAINLASGAGALVMNGNNLLDAGALSFSGAVGSGNAYIGQAAADTVSLYAGNGASTQEILRATYGGAVLENGQFITLAGQTAPQITAAGDTTTGFYQSAAGTWRYESGGTNIAVLSAAGLTMTSGAIVSPNLNLTSAAASVASGVSYGGTVTSSVSCGGSGTGGPAGCLVIRVGSTTHYVPYY